MRIYIGTSGYNYKHWADGVFYPKGLPQNKWLEHYVNFFNCVEMNVTFYRLLPKKTFDSWRKKTPKDFAFIVKGSRFITHIKRLKDIKEPLERFLENTQGLKNKLNAILWQFPSNFHLNQQRLKDFLKLLNKRVTNTRQVFEFRNESWFCDEIYRVLKNYNFSLCIAHSSHWPVKEIITSDYVYLRFHGGEVLYGSEYSEKELKSWAEKTKKWIREKKDVYAFFNNDAYGFAVKNALRLKELIR